MVATHPPVQLAARAARFSLEREIPEVSAVLQAAHFNASVVPVAVAPEARREWAGRVAASMPAVHQRCGVRLAVVVVPTAEARVNPFNQHLLAARAVRITQA